MAFVAHLQQLPAAEACNGLCLRGVETSGNHIVAQLYYYGSALHNRVVNVTLNRRYVVIIRTNESGALSMYAPLSLGKNTVSVTYGSSTVDGVIYYFGDLLGLALLPIGAASYAAIRILSERSTANKEVTIAFDGEHEGTETVLDGASALETVMRLQRGNAHWRMVRALPVSVDDAYAALCGLSDSEKKPDMERVGAVTETYHGIFCRSTTPYREIAAKKLYESAMNTGGYVAKEGMSIASFLKVNGIMHFAERRSGTWRRLHESSHINISISDRSEESTFESLLARRSSACAFLLFNELNGFVDVIRC
jgi:hypothetical protein